MWDPLQVHLSRGPQAEGQSGFYSQFPHLYNGNNISAYLISASRAIVMIKSRELRSDGCQLGGGVGEWVKRRGD